MKCMEHKTKYKPKSFYWTFYCSIIIYCLSSPVHSLFPAVDVWGSNLRLAPLIITCTLHSLSMLQWCVYPHPPQRFISLNSLSVSAGSSTTNTSANVWTPWRELILLLLLQLVADAPQLQNLPVESRRPLTSLNFDLNLTPLRSLVDPEWPLVCLSGGLSTDEEIQEDEFCWLMLWTRTVWYWVSLQWFIIIVVIIVFMWSTISLRLTAWSH